MMVEEGTRWRRRSRVAWISCLASVLFVFGGCSLEFLDDALDDADAAQRDIDSILDRVERIASQLQTRIEPWVDGTRLGDSQPDEGLFGRYGALMGVDPNLDPTWTGLACPSEAPCVDEPFVNRALDALGNRGQFFKGGLPEGTYQVVVKNHEQLHFELRQRDGVELDVAFALLGTAGGHDLFEVRTRMATWVDVAASPITRVSRSWMLIEDVTESVQAIYHITVDGRLTQGPFRLQMEVGGQTAIHLDGVDPTTFVPIPSP
jgi:hypothetical protein